MAGRGGQDEAGDKPRDFSFAKRMLEGLKRAGPDAEAASTTPPSAAGEGPPQLKDLVDALKVAPGRRGALEPDGYGHLLLVRDCEPIAPGARGDAVEALQLALRKAGLNAPGTGRFDEATEAAVKRLQEAQAVPVTGIFDAATLGALDAALGLERSDDDAEPAPVVTPRSGSGANVLPPSGNEFLDQLAPGAVRGMHESGVPASVLLAMAVIEGEWGQALLTRDYNNVFALRGTGPAGSVIMRDGGGGALVPSGEGTAYRRYANVAESVADFARVFAGAKDYQGIMSHRDHPENFARALTGAYSAEPNYGSLVVRIMSQYDLRRYDRVPPPRQGL